MPAATRASVAVDLGAESCRVSLLRWANGLPHMQLVHRFANGPVLAPDGTMRWPLDQILSGVDHGLRLCAELAPEGIRSLGVDGWAVDYVRLDVSGNPLEAPFCYRDERNAAAADQLHQRISPDRLREITGLQLQPLNTLYQRFADHLAAKPDGAVWLNLPEYLLHRWGGRPVAEYSNATHTQMIDLQTRHWSPEILQTAELPPATMPEIVCAGTLVGKLRGPLADLPAFADTALIAPACHDTASAVAGIPAAGEDWAYISLGTWSLVGTPVLQPCNGEEARAEQFTNLGLDRDRTLLQKNVNGMWLLKQCMLHWEEQGSPWEIAALCAAAELAPTPDTLLDVDDPELLKMGDMPARINTQRQTRDLTPLDESSAAAPAMASLIFHSLAARYATLLQQLERLSGKQFTRIYAVGGASRNAFLRRLTEEASGKPVLLGSPESSTVGNFALQLAALDASTAPSHERAHRYAAMLCDSSPVA